MLLSMTSHARCPMPTCQTCHLSGSLSMEPAMTFVTVLSLNGQRIAGTAMLSKAASEAGSVREVVSLRPRRNDRHAWTRGCRRRTSWR